MKRKRTVKEILERRKMKAFNHEGEVLIGKVVGVHGLKGELKVKSESDIFERQLEAVDSLTLYRGTRKEEVTVESVKPYKDIYLIKFKEINDRSQAEETIGGELWIDENERVELEEGEFYYEELLGLKVFTEDGRELGVIKNILEQPASHILEVEKSDGKTVLIPFIEQFVKEIDLKNGKVTVSLIEGMES